MLKILIIILVIVVLTAGGAIYYTYKIDSTVETAQSPSTEEINCSQFPSRFGTTSSDLVAYINNQPEAATVLKGYKNIQGEILGSEGAKDVPLTIVIDSTGKITSWQCVKSAESLGENDFSFTIPDSDFLLIVQQRDNLQENQAIEYMKNITTKPSDVKQTMLQRIQNLE